MTLRAVMWCSLVISSVLSEESPALFLLFTTAVLKLGVVGLSLMEARLLCDDNYAHLLKACCWSSCLLKLASRVLFKEKKNPYQDHFS